VTKDDPRVTRVGASSARAARRIAALFNVVGQEQSLAVGRARARHAVRANCRGRLFDEAVDGFSHATASSRLTGWAQINAGAVKSIPTSQDPRSASSSDLYYIENWSVLFDPFHPGSETPLALMTKNEKRVLILKGVIASVAKQSIPDA